MIHTTGFTIPKIHSTNLQEKLLAATLLIKKNIIYNITKPIPNKDQTYTINTSTSY